MRRKEREVTDSAIIDSIIQDCTCIRLGLADEDAPYIVPVNFGYVRENETRTFYIHCATVGRKLDLIAKNPKVGFELDTFHFLTTAEKACGFSYLYRSIIGTGMVAVVTEEAERVLGMKKVMEHYTGNADWSFDPRALGKTTILKLAVEALSCKAHDQ